MRSKWANKERRAPMDIEMEEFITSCLELGKELLDKEHLTEKEKQFLAKLDLIANKYLG